MPNLPSLPGHESLEVVNVDDGRHALDLVVLLFGFDPGMRQAVVHCRTLPVRDDTQINQGPVMWTYRGEKGGGGAGGGKDMSSGQMMVEEKNYRTPISSTSHLHYLIACIIIFPFFFYRIFFFQTDFRKKSGIPERLISLNVLINVLKVKMDFFYFIIFLNKMCKLIASVFPQYCFNIFVIHTVDIHRGEVAKI